MPNVRTKQGKYWLLTIPQHYFTPYLPNDCAYIEGQLEQGTETGFLHWQVVVCFLRRTRLGGVKTVFGDACHAELSRSGAANNYVRKEDTSIDGTYFRLGRTPFNRSDPKDWDCVLNSAKCGNFSDIPSDILIRCYSSIKNIAKDNLSPVPIERTVNVYWGPTGTGKSRRAWEEATFSAYPKDPMSKFWDGYQSHTYVVIDEFRGDIAISHVLRWFDRYPVIVEAKHGAVCLVATHIWITSNLNPLLWYPNIGDETRDALMRRLNVIKIE